MHQIEVSREDWVQVYYVRSDRDSWGFRQAYQTGKLCRPAEVRYTVLRVERDLSCVAASLASY